MSTTTFLPISLEKCCQGVVWLRVADAIITGDADPWNALTYDTPSLLRFGRERRQNHAENEHDREPD